MEDLLKNYTVVDLSRLLAEEDDGGFPVDVPFGHIIRRHMKLGDPYTSYTLLLHEHHYTHSDSPAHLIFRKDALSIHELPLESYIGRCCVFHMVGLPDNYKVSIRDIKAWEEKNRKITDGDIAVFHFGHPLLYTKPNYPGLSVEAADYLVEKKVKLVGTDAPAVDAYDSLEECPAHKRLLANNVFLVEGLTNLDKVPSTGAYFIGLPLKIKDGSGSPLRAIALVKKT